jgi:hypothetical protein
MLRLCFAIPFELQKRSAWNLNTPQIFSAEIAVIKLRSVDGTRRKEQGTETPPLKDGMVMSFYVQVNNNNIQSIGSLQLWSNASPQRYTPSSRKLVHPTTRLRSRRFTAS